MDASTLASDHLQRVRAAFIEMPGLHLTHAHAARLFAIDAVTCGNVLQQLADARFLKQTAYGGFMRATMA